MLRSISHYSLRALGKGWTWVAILVVLAVGLVALSGYLFGAPWLAAFFAVPAGFLVGLLARDYEDQHGDITW